MHEPLRTLPPTYRLNGTLDLSENKVLAWILNLLAMGAFVGFAGLLLFAAVRWRGPAVLTTLGFQLDGIEALVWLATMLGLVVGILVIHELLHAAAFRLFIPGGVIFGFKGLYAFAAAPTWYLPRDQHLLVIVTPLAVMTAVGLVLIAIAPVRWVPLTLFAVALNASGATGDLATVAWLLTKPRSAYVNDYGDGFGVYVACESEDNE
jgi:hypothetical protein